MNEIIDLSFKQVALAYLFILVVVAIVRLRGIKREKEIVISSIRMTLQLILSGYILVYIFNNPNPLTTGLIIIIMEAFAIYTVYKKFRGKLTYSLKKVIGISMIIGNIPCLLYFLFIVVQIKPWYEPQYFIPIAGMFIGNSMTGITIGVKSMLEGISIQRNLIEESLILGASSKAATKQMINSNFEVAIMPTINSMIGMGIVFLPGMMTGQILAGASPTTAIAYQIAVMLGIFSSVAITTILMLQFGYRTFFNKDNQFI